MSENISIIIVLFIGLITMIFTNSALLGIVIQIGLLLILYKCIEFK